MKFTCLDVVKKVDKSGFSFCQGAFRGEGKNGPYLFVADCPSDYEPMTDYNGKVAFTPSRNYVLPY